MENGSPKVVWKSIWRKNMPKEKYEKVGMMSTIPKALYFQGLSGFFFSWGARKVHSGYTKNFRQTPLRDTMAK